jgi:hypothetical protein
MLGSSSKTHTGVACVVWCEVQVGETFMRQWLHALGETPRMAPIHLAVPPPNPGQRALPRVLRPGPAAAAAAPKVCVHRYNQSEGSDMVGGGGGADTNTRKQSPRPPCWGPRLSQKLFSSATGCL